MLIEYYLSDNIKTLFEDFALSLWNAWPVLYMRVLMEREKLMEIWAIGGLGKRVLQLQDYKIYNVIFLPTHPFHKPFLEPSLSFSSWLIGLESVFYFIFLFLFFLFWEWVDLLRMFHIHIDYREPKT